MKAIISFLFCSILTILNVHAQTGSVVGWVYDQDEDEFLLGANILVKDSTDQLKHAAVTDNNGYFKIENMVAGTYSLEVSYVGYKSYTGQIRMRSNEEMILGRINMGAISTSLEEVEVTAKTPAVQSKGDTTEFNADAFKTAPNALAEQLVRKMPGMEMGTDGSVTAQGEQVQRVLVDGKPFFGDDPTIAMKNIPAEIIEKVQVFDQQSEQAQFTGFDDGERIKTMNIITRVEKREGTFGRLYAGYGTEDRYEGGGTTHYFAGKRRMAILGLTNNINEQNFTRQDILSALGSSGRSRWGRGQGGVGAGDFLTGNSDGINTTHSLGAYYSDSWKDKIELTTSYFGNFSKNENQVDIYRDFLIGINAGQEYDQFDDQETRNNNHRLNARLDYKFNENFSILYTPSFQWQGSNATNISDALTVDENTTIINASSLTNELERSGLQWNNRLLIRQKLPKKGRTISTSLRFNIAPGDGESTVNSLNTFLNRAGTTDTISFDQISPFDTRNLSFSARVNYTEPITEKGQLQLQYDYSFNDRDEEFITYSFNPLTAEYDLITNDLSNDILSNYQQHTPGVSYRHRLGDWSLNAEIETQWAFLGNEIRLPSSEMTDLSFFNVLPSAYISYRKSRSNQFRLIYRTSTNEPSVSQLQSAPDISDPLNVSSGNPELKQEFQHRFIIRYSKVDAEKGFNFFAFAFLQLIQDRISNQRIISDGNLQLPGGYSVVRGGQFSQPVNLSGYYSARAYMSAGKPFLNQTLNANVSLRYQISEEPSLLDQVKTNTLNQSWRPGISLSSNISDKTDFSVSGSAGLNTISRSGIEEDDVQYTSWTARGDLTQFITDRLYFQTDISYFRNQGLSEDFDEPWLLWRASVGYLLFPKKQGELRLFWFDVTKQNDQIQRIVNDIYVEDQQNTVLEPYLLLRFTWFVNAFNADSSKEFNRSGRSPHDRFRR